MSKDLHDYEQVSRYNLDPDMQEKLLREVRECVFNWSTKAGHPMGVIMSCYWKDGRMWLTAGAHRHRISAVRRDPRVSLVMTSTGTELGPGKSLTIKGHCVIHEEREVKDWFYPEFALHLYRTKELAKPFQEMLDSPMRLVLEIVPEKMIDYDGAKMFAHTAGTLDESQLGPARSSDSERLQRELEKRGLS
jgi:general stress protein 26